MLVIPSNLSLVATMNSSDQRVQAMDSAFKRRWNFLYRPVKFKADDISKITIIYNDHDIS